MYTREEAIAEIEGILKRFTQSAQGIGDWLGEPDPRAKAEEIFDIVKNSDHA